MAQSRIDELNINQPYKNRSEPYEQYFDIMAISKRQKQERIKLAEDLEDIFFEFLMFMVVLNEYKQGYEQAQVQLEIQYRDKMFEYLPESDGDFIRDYAAAYAVNAVDTTAKHIEKLNGSDIGKASEQSVKKRAEKIKEKIADEVEDALPLPAIAITASEAENQPEVTQADSWYVSLDRAKFNAENEANTVLNRSDFLKAKEAGFIRKRWITEHDNRVRPTHQEVEDVTIPIDSLFAVGDSLFSFPRDLTYSPNPNEVVNCRCSVKYLM